MFYSVPSTHSENRKAMARSEELPLHCQPETGLRGKNDVKAGFDIGTFFLFSVAAQIAVLGLPS